MHTRCSDGIWGVERLLDEVRVRDLGLFCISDHDTLDAYPLPEDLASRAIPGLEVDSHLGGHTVHLLAYGVCDKTSPLMNALCRQRSAREERMASMVDAVRRHGIDVSLDDVRAQARGTASLGRPHLARALVACGAVPSVQDAFDRYLADDANSYVALERLTAADAIALIHASCGVAIAAHPMRLRNDSDLAELIDEGIDGIEIAHPTADPQAQARLLETARANGLLSTAGTDFHAPLEGRPIGVPFPTFEIDRLREALDRRARQ
ncbi:MAG: PHP domain-containing protein [Candidatus Eremiobacteraeota bacterium]|nr:PHP domain-containing protein [Candidatus Eremiobacteraeota bacterium]